MAASDHGSTLPQSFDIDYSRFGSQIIHELSGALTAREPVYLARRVGHIPEDHSARGAGLDAGWYHIAIAKRPVLGMGIHFGFADALDAERAFFHDALGANRNFRIPGFVERFGPNRVIEVEKPYRIGTIIRTVACSDAAVVDLGVQSFVGMVCRKHWTDWLTWRFIAVLAEHRHKADADIGELTFKIAFDPDPINRPAF
jgi:hypothetical protein